MNKQQLFEQIEAYLAGKLSVEERNVLERQIAEDSELAAEVSLHRQVEKLLTDHPKLEFLQKLADLSAEFSTPPGPSPDWRSRFRRWWWLPVLIAAIVPFLWWWGVRSENNIPAQTEKPTIQPEDTPTEIMAPSPTPDPVDTARNPVLTPVPQASLRRYPENSVYARNPEMEKWLASSPDDFYKVDTVVLEKFPGDSKGTYNVRFYGRMITALDPPQMELVLSDNRLPAGKETWRMAVTATLIPDSENTFAFAARKTYNLEASGTAVLANGLYYCRLLRPGGAHSIWTGRLVVGK